ncbi:MAG: aspartate carbamoyltransferase catalytic subunit [Gammaproteobacteria bacterium]|nr:aspartate carbamoyltransferase catalytic subunit [Pseudomonadota bacterium]MCH9663348.1 aspartate carbamoyltransferase catalytic subunit [Gammaproteobacteria bacterium]
MTTTPTKQRRGAQLNQRGELCHLLDIKGLEREHIEHIMNQADSFFAPQENLKGSAGIRKLPLLRGHTVANLFFENSTRTRMTFQLAASKLSADLLDWQLDTSAVLKGETLLDTVHNIEAMHARVLIVRHPWSGSSQFVAENCHPETTVINAGDGCHAHPTQALLDLYTIARRMGEFSGLRVAIIGDIRHSRVARSLSHGLSIMGCRDIRLISPPLLRSSFFAGMPGVRSLTRVDEGIEGCDVVVVLRLQLERMRESFGLDAKEYARDYGLSEARLARLGAHAIIMHPGPVNRGVEIAADVADSAHSLILEQVHNGIAVRMAVMTITIGNLLQS